MRKIYYIFICLFTLTSCDKDIEDNLEGDATISGQASYVDNLNGQGELKILARKKVFIATANSDSVNYLYYTVTDAQGNFTFKRLKDDTEYLIFISDTTGGVHFSTYIKKKAPVSDLTLIAANDTVRQNGMLYYVRNSQNEPLKNVAIGLFNNEEIFKSDTSNKLAMETKTTDMYGRVVFFNYRPGSYYLRAKYNTIAGSISADSSYSFTGKGISTKTITLKTELALKNTVLIKVVDEAGNLLPSIKCCIFNNPLLFNVEVCEGKYLEKTSETNGTIKLTNVEAGNYYVFAQTTLNNVNYKAKITANVKAIGQTDIEVVLKKVTPNELLVRTVNEAGNVLPGMSFCLFNNPLQFNTESCTGWYRQEVTKIDGSIRLNDLPAGSYYLYAETAVGSTTYKGKAFINITPTGQTSLDLVLKKVIPNNELEITTKDDAATPVNGTTLYFFTSKKLWEADTTLGNIKELITLSNGKVSTTNMEEGKYYIRARLQLGGKIMMKGADSVTVINSSSKTTKTIVIR